MDSNRSLTALGAALEGTLVECWQQRLDGRIELGQREESATAQPRQNSALDDLHRHLALALSFGLYGRAGSTAVP